MRYNTTSHKGEIKVSVILLWTFYFNFVTFYDDGGDTPHKRIDTGVLNVVTVTISSIISAFYVFG